MTMNRQLGRSSDDHNYYQMRSTIFDFCLIRPMFSQWWSGSVGRVVD